MRQVEVLAFVPDLDVGAAEFAETWDLLAQRLGDRADHGDGLDFLKGDQRVGHDVSGAAKIVLRPQEVTILLFDLLAPRLPS